MPFSSRAQQTSTLRIKLLSASTGAECTGVDLTRFDEADWQQMLQTYHLQSLLVIPNQKLQKQDQIAFSERFGELELPIRKDYLGTDFAALHVVNNMGPDGKPKGTKALDNPGNYFWHTDASYMHRPASTTLLYAIKIPETGGDTNFANMQAAYKALPAEMKDRIKDMRAIHSWEQSRHNSGSRLASEEEKLRAPPVAHPLVRTHPGTGRKGLYLGNHTSHIEGMAVEKGRALLKELLVHATQPQFVYRHKWTVGDLVIWDNRSLLHKASDDFDMSNVPRILHRTVVQGTVPA